MATKTGGKAKRFTFQWKIENVSNWWWLRRGNRIESPTFEVEGNEITKWNLWLYPKKYEDFIGIYLHRERDCSGADAIQVKFHFAFLTKDGSSATRSSSLKGDFWRDHRLGVSKFEKRKNIFGNGKEEIIVEDTLTVQCIMWIKGERHLKSNHVFSSTINKVKRRAFCCRIDKDATRYKFKDYSFGFDVVLKENCEDSAVNLTSFDDGKQYISCNISIILLNGTKQNFKFIKYFASDLEEGVLSTTLSLPSTFTRDILSLQFDFVMSIIEQFRYGKKYVKLEIEKEKRVNTRALTDDYKSLYYYGVFSDVNLRTSTKKFPVHKGILSARSPVFRNMFNSNMMDQNSKDLKIEGFEDDILHRMFLYIYSDFLEDLNYEIACKLYKISDFYQILSLKYRCSSFLEEKLCHTNACDILVLADRYIDDDLKNAAQDYILRERKQIFRSVEWKDIMSAHPKLAADLMYTKIIKSMM